MTKFQKELALKYKNRYRSKNDTSKCYFMIKKFRKWQIYLCFHFHYKYGKSFPKIFLTSTLEKIDKTGLKRELLLRIF